VSVSHLQQAFGKRRALVTYLMGGDGGVEASVRALVSCAQSGADVLEIGFPFSDPIADGRVIQAAASRALEAHVTLATVFEIAQQVRSQTPVPLVLMGYLNPVLAFGVERFMAKCAACGIDGVIIPDLPPEEASEWCAAAKAHDVATIFLLAPTSTAAREQTVLSVTTGFVYFVSVTGVTGARTAMPDIEAQVTALRAKSTVPLAIGFGISTPEQAQKLGAWADGVVVGSALVERCARGEDLRPLVSAIREALSA
jgi:tryptophan synthase alpha chain